LIGWLPPASFNGAAAVVRMLEEAVLAQIDSGQRNCTHDDLLKKEMARSA
jgi:hypothetical protein